MATILNFFFLPWGIKPFLFHNGTLWFTLRALQLCSSWMNGIGVKGWRKKETITGVGVFFLPAQIRTEIILYVCILIMLNVFIFMALE